MSFNSELTLVHDRCLASSKRMLENILFKVDPKFSGLCSKLKLKEYIFSDGSSYIGLLFYPKDAVSHSDLILLVLGLEKDDFHDQEIVRILESNLRVRVNPEEFE